MIDYAKQYNHYKKFSIEDVYNLWFTARHECERSNGKKYYKWDKIQIADGVTVKMDSQRYQVFFERGIDCVCCGLKGQYFWLEQNRNQPGTAYHFNLYGVYDDGNEVQLTKDHIIPKSKGGKNYIDNYQTMCDRCNMDKADKIAQVYTMSNIVWIIVDADKGIIAFCSTEFMAAKMANVYVSANYPVDTIEECENVEIRRIELDTWMNY